MGTGDGLFAYRCALAQPQRFFIGIDANSRPLEKISEKIYRKPAKGGLSNLLFVQSAVEDLPCELDGLIEELHVNLPWGSLLAAVAGTNNAGLVNLRRMCMPTATMKVIVALDQKRDAAALQRLKLPEISLEYIDNTLISIYRNSGFDLTGRNVWTRSEHGNLRTSWAKRLLNTSREVVSVIARAV